jgi:anti-sigma-K factor RskA
VAQTRRKRQTKHRGNAAGIVESRGRTGRKPTAAERSAEGRQKAQSRQQKEHKFDQPPTWRSAFYRALAAAVLMMAVSLLLLKKPGESFALFPLVLALYVPIGYYSDVWMYKRRMRQKAARGEGTAAR